MNSVERLVTYAELPAEGAATTPQDPPSSWPDRGEITFKNVEMSYREGLPLVLKGVPLTCGPARRCPKYSPPRGWWFTLIYRLASSGEQELVRNASPKTGHLLTRCTGKSSIRQALFR
jgi:ABC-type multidrug transport system fused ATPase/permease subunit